MKNPKLAGKVIKAVVDAVDIPVTVKIRKGFNDDLVNAPEMAQVAQENGAAAITEFMEEQENSIIQELQTGPLSAR